ncbi:MAG: glycogen debranching enzyme, partial [Actinomycetota bacterium]|nr:glycogen debranching enzyme [Actinomycetota bacterium]
GPTDDPEIRKRRSGQQRNFLLTLMASQGVPMIAHGDELGRTQGGNNNAYCQDSELSWLDWDHADEALLDFTRRAVALRASHPVLSRQRWLGDSRGQNADRPAARWYHPSGEPMSSDHWADEGTRALALVLDGTIPTGVTPQGEDITDDVACLMFNGHLEATTFVVPGSPTGQPWEVVLDSVEASGVSAEAVKVEAGSSLERPGLSSVLLISKRAAD